MRAPGCLVLSISELPPTQPIEVVDVIGAAPPAPALPEPHIIDSMELAA